MGKSVLVFISHSSEDKKTYIDPIVTDLENCFINVWIDRRNIVPGDNLRKSIFQDGLDKADVVLLFFTEQSLQSAWVDREIKHVLREETKKGNNFDLHKIISIFDSQETYAKISERYPELTDDLLHLMPQEYDKTQLGQLISAIWSKYLALQGGDVETQRQLLGKEKEIFQKEKEIQELKIMLQNEKSKDSKNKLFDEFKMILASGKLDKFIELKDLVLGNAYLSRDDDLPQLAEAVAFGLLEFNPATDNYLQISEKGKDFFKWILLENNQQKNVDAAP
ncbi:MAG: toll/interleukin-1 receptor domain-containing protein [Anaerolineales bacterium]